MPEFPAEIVARRHRAKAGREKQAKRARRTAMGPREIAAGLAAAATPLTRVARRGRPPINRGDVWTRLRAARDIRNRPPTPATTSPLNVLGAVGLVPTPGRRTATPTTVETSSGTTPAQAPEQITSPQDQALALGVSQELDLNQLGSRGGNMSQRGNRSGNHHADIRTLRTRRS